MYSLDQEANSVRKMSPRTTTEFEEETTVKKKSLRCSENQSLDVFTIPNFKVLRGLRPLDLAGGGG